MKKTTTIFLVYFLTANVSGQQLENLSFKYEMIYELQYQTDSLNPESADSEFMVLYFNNSSSKFSSVGKHFKDSLFDSYENRSMENFADFQSKVPPMKYKYEIFQNISRGKSIYAEKLGRDKLLYEESLTDLDWQIEKETSEIAGYKVRKATTSYAGRQYIAWFTEEIPISSGPYKFGGLPGMILKIGDVRNHYVFTITGLKQLEEPVEYSLNINDYLVVDREKFQEVQEGFLQDPFAALERSGMSFGFQSGQREGLMKGYRKGRKKFNNPIELE